MAGMFMPALAKVGALKLPLLLRAAGITAGAAPYIATNVYEDWFVEEARIRGGYNNTSVNFGAKAYLVEDEPQQQTFKNRLIYSFYINKLYENFEYLIKNIKYIKYKSI